MPACARDCLFELTAAIAASAADITLLRSIMEKPSTAVQLTKDSATRGTLPLNKPLWETIAFSSEVGTGSRKENASEEEISAAGR
jgi:hypothetical protein